MPSRSERSGSLAALLTFQVVHVRKQANDERFAIDDLTALRFRERTFDMRANSLHRQRTPARLGSVNDGFDFLAVSHESAQVRINGNAGQFCLGDDACFCF